MVLRILKISCVSLFVLLVGCQYEGPLSGVSCEDDGDCPYSAPCVEGWCDLGGGGLPDASEEDGEGDAAEPDSGDCAANEVLCDGECVDTQSSLLHCGSCSASCPTSAGGTAECIEGACSLSCLEDFDECDGQCVDLTNDANFCGGCELSCSEADGPNTVDVCVDSECDVACETGYGQCPDGCVDLARDPENCGACGNACPLGNCNDGSCHILPCLAEGDPFGGGTGSPDEPFTICTADHLSRVGGHLEAHFVLSENIDLAGFSDMTLFPIGYYDDGDDNAAFQGHFDGYGLEIRNLTMNAYEPDIGIGDGKIALFGFVGDEGVVENVRLVDVDVYGKEWVSGLVGRNRGMITDCEVTGAVKSDGAFTGGVVMVNEGTITGCSTNLVVEGGAAVGGIAGSNFVNGRIFNSHAHGSVDGQSEQVGGLVGINLGTIDDSHAHGDVEGIADRCGGLVGTNYGRILNSSAHGTVTGMARYTGGLVGHNEENASIDQSYATGPVNGHERTGGLAGINSGSISQSYAEGAVTATNSRVGGLVGYNQGNGTIEDSYATGDISSTSGEVGGLVGRNRNDITHCFAFGQAAGSGNLGGLVGDTGGDVYDSYWNTDVNDGDTGGDNGDELTEAEFMDIGSFVEWDFNEVWQMSGSLGRPILQWQN